MSLPPAHPLSLLCRCLSLDDADASALARLLRRHDQDWAGLFHLAGLHLVTPSLAGCLRRKGVFDGLPAEVRDYLSLTRRLNRDRNRQLRDELMKITARLNAVGVEPLLLKGAIALTPAAYPGAADRVIGDLDLWVPLDRIGEARAAIQALGYQIDENYGRNYLPSDRAADHQEAPLLHPDQPVAVELHRRITHQPEDDTLLMSRVRPVPLILTEGARVTIPDPLTRLRHNFLHAQVTDRLHRRRGLNLRQLLEFATLARCYRAEIDTGELPAGLRSAHWAALAEYTALAEHWLGLGFPPSLRRSTHERRALWLVEQVATRPRWHTGFQFYDEVCRLPRRGWNLLLRLGTDPGYFRRRWFRG